MSDPTPSCPGESGLSLNPNSNWDMVFAPFQSTAFILELAFFDGRGLWQQLSAWLASPGIPALFLRAVRRVHASALRASDEAFSGPGPFLSKRCMILSDCVASALPRGISLVAEVQQASRLSGQLLPQLVGMVRAQLIFTLPFIVNTMRKDLNSYVKPVTFMRDCEGVLTAGMSTFNLNWLDKLVPMSFQQQQPPCQQPWIQELYPDIVRSLPSLVAILELARGYGILMDDSPNWLLKEAAGVIEKLFDCLSGLSRAVVEPHWAKQCLGIVQLADFVLSEVDPPAAGASSAETTRKVESGGSSRRRVSTNRLPSVTPAELIGLLRSCSSLMLRTGAQG